MLWETVALSALALYLFYRWATYHYDFFEKRGIPYDKPFPLLGSMFDVITKKKSFFDGVVDLYNKHDGRVYGIFDQRIPVTFVRDPDMIKQITIKDFDHFVNHRVIFDDASGSNLFASSLFMLQDAKWKDMRSTLSPFFTGSKMRQMFHLMNKVAKNTSDYLKAQPGINTPQGLELDLKDYCTRFTSDIIASTAFGIEVNSLTDKNNEFYMMGKKVTQFTAWQNFKFFMYANFKYIMDLFKAEIFDKKQSDYFMRLVLDAMKYRKDHNITRPDMINMLMEARGLIPPENGKAPNREWNDIEVVAQCFLFFFAGFETSATLMCFVAHELMENPEIQQRLYEEIEDVTRDLDGKELSYEKLNNMKYLDMVVSETLRKWPAAISIDRKCNKDFVYQAEDGWRFEIKKGDYIQMPVCGFHRDPKYYENPMKFDPERFNDDNKHNINQFTYFPFGLGPRNCIGSRFALLEAKAVIFYLVQHFRMEVSSKSTVPLELSSAGFQMLPKTGFWFRFVARG